MLLQVAISFLKKTYDFICYLISPPLCFACRGHMVHRATLCPKCDQSIDVIVPKMFTVNSKYILTVYTVSRYTDPLRSMIFAKYRSDRVVFEKLADIIWDKSVLSQVQFDFLIPIPLHWTRNLKRGFNQAEVIADRLSHHSGVSVLHALKRERRTQYQVRVEHGDRVQNIKKSMAATGLCKKIEGKHIMLVDDSCTTGATALEACKVLVKYRPASINMIVACRAL